MSDMKLYLRLSCLLSFMTLVVSSTLRYSVTEEGRSGDFIGNLVEDSGLLTRYETSILRQLRYSFLTAPGDKMTLFTLDENTGMLYTGSRVDHDVLCPRLLNGERCLVEFDVAVSPPRPEVLTVSVEIIDINDNHPEFSLPRLPLDITEGSRVGSTLNLLPAVDLDSGRNGLTRYELVTPSEYFELRVRDMSGTPGSVKLELMQELDRESISMFRLVVIATDGGSPRKSGTLALDIVVNDVNDHVPVFEGNTDTYTATIPEDISAQGSVLTIVATDEDDGDNGHVEYFIAESAVQEDINPTDVFSINSLTGVVSVMMALDYEMQPLYTLIVEAVDGGSSPNTAYATMNIRITDVNDNAPEISIDTLTPSGRALIEEDSVHGTFVAYVSVRDRDADGLQEFSCTLSDTSVFQLELLQRTRYQVVTKNVLDREAIPSYNLTVTCRDSGEPEVLSTTRDILITVTDKNDNAPLFTSDEYTAEISENNNIGDLILQVTALDLDEDINGEVTYQLSAEVSEYFLLNPQSGIITANTVFDYERLPGITFVVYSLDRGVPVQTSTAVVTLSIKDTNDEAPTFLQLSYTFRVREEQDGGAEVGQVSAADGDSIQFSDITYSLDSEISGAMNLFTIDADTGTISTTQTLRREERPVYYLTVIALNTGEVSPVLSGTASVTVSILDVNNNTPIITYPTTNNHTITISNNMPVGETFLTVAAYDLDDGINAKLRYTLTSLTVRDDVAFRVNPTTGDVHAVTSLQHIDDVSEFEYNIQVSDGLHEARQYMLIIVDSSVPYGGDTSSEDKSLLTGSNLTIVVAMTVSCAVIVIILVIAIILIRSKDKRRRQRKQNNNRAISPDGHLYHCQIEAQHPVNNENGELINCNGSIPIRQQGHSLSKATGSKAVHIQSNAGNSWPSRGQSQKHVYSLSSDNVWPLSAQKLGAQHPQCDYEVKAGEDTDSAYSGDVSNTDSGRGASEEGELTQQHPAGKHRGNNSFSTMHYHPHGKPREPPGPIPSTSRDTGNEKSGHQGGEQRGGHPYYSSTLLPPAAYHHKRQPSSSGDGSRTSLATSQATSGSSHVSDNSVAPPRPAPPRPVPRCQPSSTENLYRHSTGSNGSSTSGSYVVDDSLVFLEGTTESSHGRGVKSIVV